MAQCRLLIMVRFVPAVSSQTFRRGSFVIIMAIDRQSHSHNRVATRQKYSKTVIVTGGITQLKQEIAFQISGLTVIGLMQTDVGCASGLLSLNIKSSLRRSSLPMINPIERKRTMADNHFLPKSHPSRMQARGPPGQRPDKADDDHGAC